jgi:hypothetical protein
VFSLRNKNGNGSSFIFYFRKFIRFLLLEELGDGGRLMQRTGKKHAEKRRRKNRRDSEEPMLFPLVSVFFSSQQFPASLLGPSQ